MTSHVTARRVNSEHETISALIRFCKGDYLLGELENEYPTISVLLKVFAIGERENIWEVLEQGQSIEAPYQGTLER